MRKGDLVYIWKGVYGRELWFLEDCPAYGSTSLKSEEMDDGVLNKDKLEILLPREYAS